MTVELKDYLTALRRVKCMADNGQIDRNSNVTWEVYKRLPCTYQEVMDTTLKLYGEPDEDYYLEIAQFPHGMDTWSGVIGFSRRKTLDWLIKRATEALPPTYTSAQALRKVLARLDNWSHGNDRCLSNSSSYAQSVVAEINLILSQINDD